MTFHHIDLPIVRSVLHPTDFSDASHTAFAYALAVVVSEETGTISLAVDREIVRELDGARLLRLLRRHLRHDQGDLDTTSRKIGSEKKEKATVSQDRTAEALE